MCDWLHDETVSRFTAHLKNGHIVREETEGREPKTFDPATPYDRLRTNAHNHGGWHVPEPAHPNASVEFRRK